MKLMMILIVFSLTTASFAKSNVASYTSLKQVLNCGMKILENQRMNQEIALGLIDIFKKLTNDNAEALLTQCLVLKKKARKAPYYETDGLEQFFDFRVGMEHREFRVRFALSVFSSGKYDCQTNGVEVDAAVLLHVGVGINLGQCRSYTGRRYLLVAPELSVGGGLGAYVLFESSKFTLRQDQLFRDEDQLTLVAGAGYVESRPLRGSSGSHGGGVGIGASLKMTTTLNLKLIQLGRDYQFLMDQLSDSKLD